ncbi:MAG TPA: hypothetical protein VIF62_02240 [Labilithrix sp.]
MLLGEEPPEEVEPPPSSVAVPAVRLEPRGDKSEPLVFRQGAHPPYGIRWYGITSLFGHLRNLTARVIASESVDSRDWMRPSSPEETLEATLDVLRAPKAETLVEALGRPVWIDFVADTGDDRDVSAAVGAMLAATYTEGDRFLPRGDLLVFGGDVAYPVATAEEIYKRLVLPWNEQLRRVGASSRKRALLGVPGNHDWYDGLDGFGRLFRRRVDEPFRSDDRDTTSRLGKQLRQRPGRKLGVVARQLHLDEVGASYGLLVGMFRSVRAFLRGVAVRRRRRLVLRGYEPVQEASYFTLPIAPWLDLFGADRQLGRVDFRQRTFFTRRRKEHPEKAVLFVSGDPAYAYGLRNDPGARMIGACRLSFERDRVFMLAGDFHHYERRSIGKSLHVIAGGGGAFLHGTRIAPYPAPLGPPDVVYPTAAACRKLAAQVPVKLTIGRAGLLVHWALALLASIELGAAREGTTALIVTGVLLSLALALGLYFVAHQGHGKKRIATLAAPFGVGLGMLPMLLSLALPELSGAKALASDGAVLVATAFAGAFVFGLYLMALCVLGLEHQQAFTVLGHPGYKHFVRLCVHPDGRIEAWTIGKDDMLAEGAPLMIDKFEWAPGPPDPTSLRISRRPPASSNP